MRFELPRTLALALRDMPGHHSFLAHALQVAINKHLGAWAVGTK
ncbi:MAG: hypothetical protein WCD36_14080 [Rhodanobacteraceae bacterium]